MVERYEKEAIVVDLDGTLIQGNSMKLFCRWSVCQMLARGRIATAILMLWWISARLLRLTSHAHMKQAFLKICEGKFSDKDIYRFLEQNLNSIINGQVLDMAYKSRCIMVLATAAPALYAEPFGRSLGFDHVLATKYSKTDFTENIGEKKLESVNRLLSKIGAEMVIVITDHADDAPLLRANRGQNYLVKHNVVTKL